MLYPASGRAGAAGADRPGLRVPKATPLVLPKKWKNPRAAKEMTRGDMVPTASTWPLTETWHGPSCLVPATIPRCSNCGAVTTLAGGGVLRWAKDLNPGRAALLITPLDRD